MRAALLLGLTLLVWVPVVLHANDAEEARMIAVIHSRASAEDKTDACGRLKQIGTARSVPALASLLADEHLFQAACNALTTLPGAEASEALRAALKTSSGKAQAGVIHALGERRYSAAVPDLTGLLPAADPLIAAASARALGEIGGHGVVPALREALKLTAVRAAAVDALLRCAARFAAEGDQAAALKLFQEFVSPQESEPVRAAAFAGLIRSSGGRALELFVSGIEGPDPARQITALQLAREIENPQATVAFTNLLPESSPAVQAGLLALLEQRGDSRAVPAVISLASSLDSHVRISAIAALGVLGDASVVPVLATAAASRDEPEQKAARQALIALRRGDVGRMMVSQLTVASTEVQAELARALAARAEKSAVPPLLELARSNSETTRRSALRALSLLADGSHLGPLVELMTEATSEMARAEVRGVFESVVDRAEDRKSFDVGPLMSSLSSGSQGTRIALLQVSALLADARVRAAFRSMMKDSDPQIRAAAARSLCDTRDPDLLPDLLELARSATEVNLRALALEGYVRLVREEASGFDAARRAELLQPAVELASRAEERRLVLSALGSAPHRNSLLLTERALTDRAVSSEAEMACLQIAKALAVSDPDAAEAALRRLMGEGSATTRTNAQAILKQFDSGWLCAGPYRREGTSAQDLFDVAFAPEQAGGGHIIWRRAPGASDLSRQGEVVLDKLVGGDHCVVYLTTRVFVPAAQRVNLEIGSDDGVKFWVNGELVHANNAVRGLTPGQDRAAANLRAGWNELLAKITQHTLGCGMTLRIVTADGKEVSGLQFDPRGGSK